MGFQDRFPIEYFLSSEHIKKTSDANNTLKKCIQCAALKIFKQVYKLCHANFKHREDTL